MMFYEEYTVTAPIRVGIQSEQVSDGTMALLVTIDNVVFDAVVPPDDQIEEVKKLIVLYGHSWYQHVPEKWRTSELIGRRSCYSPTANQATDAALSLFHRICDTLSPTTLAILEKLEIWTGVPDVAEVRLLLIDEHKLMSALTRFDATASVLVEIRNLLDVVGHPDISRFRLLASRPDTE